MTMLQYANKGWLIEAQRRLLGNRSQTSLRAAYVACVADKPDWITSSTMSRLRLTYDKLARDMDKPAFRPEI